MQALECIIPTKVGPKSHPLDAACWVVVETNINYVRRDAHITLWGFAEMVTLEELLSGTAGDPIAHRTYDWSGADFPFTPKAMAEDGATPQRIATAKIVALENETVDANGAPVKSPGEFVTAKVIVLTAAGK